MKFLTSQLAYLTADREARANLRALATYLGGRLDLALDENPAALRSQPLAPTNTPAAAAELSEEDALRALMGGGN